MRLEKAYGTDPDPNVQELIRVAMQSRSTDTRNVITKKAILKTLFLTRVRLPDKNPVKRSLAFYWYKDGPYSEIVENNLKMLVSDRRVDRSKTAAWETYKLVPEHASRPIAPRDSLMDEAAGVVRSVSKEFVDVHDIVRHIYETAAPTPWYVSYRLEFMPKFEAHCKDVREGRESRHTPKQVLECLDDAVLDFPAASEFLGIRMTFMDFAKILNAFLRWDSYRTHGDLLDELSTMCNDIWDTFAYGMRVYHHDPYYEHHAGGWMREYERKLRELDRVTLERVRKFDRVVADDTRLAPDMEDMVLHPERHTFKPLEVGTVADPRWPRTHCRQMGC